MKLFSSIMIGGVLLTSYASALNYGISMQPVRYDAYESDDDDDDDDDMDSQGYQRGWNRGFGGFRGGDLNTTVCEAIQQQSTIQAVLKTKEVVSPKELKIAIEMVTIEPYAFGMTRDGMPVVKGNVVEHKDLKVITIKTYDDKFRAKSQKPEKGWYNSDTGVRLVDLRRVKHLRMIGDRRFEVPKDFKGFQDDKNSDIQPICGLPVNDKNAPSKQNGKYQNR